MKLNNSNIFDDNNDISLDEYDIDSLVDKNIEINENNFPTVSIGTESPSIHSSIIDDSITSASDENIAIENNNQEASVEAYTEEENKIYNEIESNIGISEDDLNIISDVDDFNLENHFQNVNNDETVEAYTEEENRIYNEIENNVGISEDDLNAISDVDDFNLESFFANSAPSIEDTAENDSNNNEDTISIDEISEDNTNDVNNETVEAYTEEENRAYNEIESNVGISEDDLNAISDVDDFNLESFFANSTPIIEDSSNNATSINNEEAANEISETNDNLENNNDIA
ncbi:hypothetical protein R4J01_12240, partial [Brachyspira pilosicoli]